MPELITITDPDDPRIAAYCQVRERDLVGREGLFIAEGEIVVRILARAPRFAVQSMLLAERQAVRLAEVWHALPDAVPVYQAKQAVMDAIVGFPIHRGILAVGQKPLRLDLDTVLSGLGPKALVVGLSAIANTDNMGGIMRNAAAFGVDAVVLDSDCCDPLYRKAIRVAVGASLLVPFVELPPGADMVGQLQVHGFETLALSPSGETELGSLIRSPRCALLLGAEGPGLGADVLGRARSVRIQMASGWDSLNVATTSGIVLHHLSGLAAAQ